MKGALIDGRYLLLASIGAGGEARVFRALDQKTQSEVAVRVGLHPVGQEVRPDRPAFHSGWVHLLATGDDPHYGAYQIFELLEGRTLGQIISTGPLANIAWREFVDQSLAALEALHAAGWVHGDINAGNFLQTADRWKLLELPFLRLHVPEGRSALFGSIHTLAPEQFNGAPSTLLTDSYALGCLYYYAASGAYPHPGKTSAEIAISSLRFAPVPLREIAPNLPAAWSDWVMHFLAPKPEDRLPSLVAARQLLGVA